MTLAAPSELAPTGTLRVGINFGNALLAGRDESGVPRGIAVDLARELSRRAGVSMEIVSYESAGRMADGAKSGAWDVALLATDPARAEEIAFTAPYLEIDTTYLVWADSQLRTLGDVDHDGVRISVTDRSAYDLFLKRTVKHAQLIRAPIPEASIDLFFSEKLDALAGLRPLLLEIAEKHPDTRVLDGRFTAVRQAIGTLKGRAATATYLHAFVEDLKTSGFIAKTVERNQVRGVSVAPLAPEDDQPSRTSIWAAAARAIGAREPDARVRNPDLLAERLIGPDERAILGDHPLNAALDQSFEEARGNISVLAPARMLIVRTRFIDERLEAAIRDGVDQIVILGAGFDSRAYRFAELLRSIPVFEVDRPQTQHVKIQRVREAIGEPPDNLSYVPIDFRNDQLSGVLSRAGYRTDRRTFVIWEGVTMYLPADAVRDTLRWISANVASPSTIVFDYTYQRMIEMSRNVDIDKLPEIAKEAVRRFRSLTANEPWIFGLPDNSEKEFLSNLGWELRKVMGINSAEAVEKYLTRTDGSIFGFFPATAQQAYLILEAALPTST